MSENGLLIGSRELTKSRGLTRFITTEIVRNATIGRSLARLCIDAGLTVRSVVMAAPVFRDFDTADQLFGLRRTLARVSLPRVMMLKPCRSWEAPRSRVPSCARAWSTSSSS